MFRQWWMKKLKVVDEHQFDRLHQLLVQQDIAIQEAMKIHGFQAAWNEAKLQRGRMN